jgi:hypothetical protein
MLDGTERATHAPCAVEKLSGWQVCQPELLYVSVDGVGHARRYTVGSRGKRADVWSPHTVLGRGVLRRDITASRNGLGCEYGCRDQRGRHEGHFGHFFLHMVPEAKESLSSLL